MQADILKYSKQDRLVGKPLCGRQQNRDITRSPRGRALQGGKGMDVRWKEERLLTGRASGTLY